MLIFCLNFYFCQPTIPHHAPFRITSAISGTLSACAQMPYMYNQRAGIAKIFVAPDFSKRCSLLKSYLHSLPIFINIWYTLEELILTFRSSSHASYWLKFIRKQLPITALIAGSNS
jgi:hypothetical protein